MFFPERITAIRDSDRVLEIGPGADPHPRSDVLLEMAFDDQAEYVKQFGHDRPLTTQKPVVFYDGVTFPFKDGEFDYVICSHVLEHVPDPERFIAEVFRVASRGYFEYPLITYEYLYSIGAHLNFVKYTSGTLKYMRKSDSPLSAFKPVQEYFFKTMVQGHVTLVQTMPTHFMEGFEWTGRFQVERTMNIGEFCSGQPDPPPFDGLPLHTVGMRRLLKALSQAARARIFRS